MIKRRPTTGRDRGAGTRWRRITAGAAVAAAALGLAIAPAVHAQAGHPPAHSELAPQVRHTGAGPTGYTVTFHYYDPSATRVQIKGEWYVGNPYQLDSLAGLSETDVVPTPGLLPSQWQPGDIPMPYPNSTAANWPVMDMIKARDDELDLHHAAAVGGVQLRLLRQLRPRTQTRLHRGADPATRRGMYRARSGFVEPVSQVYVPSDPRFKRRTCPGRRRARPHGTLTDVTYHGAGLATPAGTTSSPSTRRRATTQSGAAYPTLYMFAPDDEVAWSSAGRPQQHPRQPDRRR